MDVNDKWLTCQHGGSVEVYLNYLNSLSRAVYNSSKYVYYYIYISFRQVLKMSDIEIKAKVHFSTKLDLHNEVRAAGNWNSKFHVFV